ncbi:hypothetical protein L2E82_51657 [Cichorium intybus]|nr:hypothetical protein L2E82_51657 [Cichorium intybus]
METDIKLNMKLGCNSNLEASIANSKIEESNSGVIVVEAVYKVQNSSDIPMELIPTVQNEDIRQGLKENLENNKTPVTMIEPDSFMQKGNFLQLNWTGMNEKQVFLNVKTGYQLDKHQKSVESKSFAETVDSSSSSLNATIRVIPKRNGSNIGEVEICEVMKEKMEKNEKSNKNDQGNEGMEVDGEEKDKNEKKDDDGFTLVTKKSHKGKKIL